MRSKNPIQVIESGPPFFDFTYLPDYEPQVQMHRADPPHASRLTPHSTGTTVLAFDFGEKNIGVAVGDLGVGIAHPLVTIRAAAKQRRNAAIEALIEEWQPASLVVGLPAHMDGTEHELSRLARKFARELGARCGLPVALVDERLSSAAAAASLSEAGVASRKSKPLLDQVAAQLILQAYLDSRARAR